MILAHVNLKVLDMDCQYIIQLSKSVPQIHIKIADSGRNIPYLA